MKAAISGNFANHKRVPSRSVLQIIIEIPIEQTMDALNALGDPMPGKDIPVAIARLVPDSALKSTAAAALPAPSPQDGNKEKDYTTAAKLLAKDKNFIWFINADTEEEAEQEIEKRCGVASCRDIKHGTPAGDQFAKLYAEFQEHLRFGGINA